MVKIFTKKKNQIGLSPDSLLFLGEKRLDVSKFSIIDYNENELVERTIDKVSDIKPFLSKRTTTWFNIDGVHDQNVMLDISENFQFEKYVLADIMNTQNRPKINEFSTCVFLSIKMMRMEEEEGRVINENLSIILTPQVVLSFQEYPGDVFDPVRERIRTVTKKRLRTSGTDYLTFCLLDIVIDNYIYIVSLLGEKIELLDDKLTESIEDEVLDEINTYKRELNYLRKNILPAKEMILALSKLDSELIHESNKVFFKELVDNIMHVTESLENFREILSDQLNMYNTLVNNRLNDIMKFLTIFSAVFIPITFIAGVYGTNFDNIPELHAKNGYFIMLGGIVFVAFGMLYYFKRKKWF
jgi:magnesium transporter